MAPGAGADGCSVGPTVGSNGSLIPRP
jgi:hypothetical protein